jgi:hypothetical protein
MRIVGWKRGFKVKAEKASKRSFRNFSESDRARDPGIRVKGGDIDPSDHW